MRIQLLAYLAIVAVVSIALPIHCYAASTVPNAAMMPPPRYDYNPARIYEERYDPARTTATAQCERFTFKATDFASPSCAAMLGNSCYTFRPAFMKGDLDRVIRHRLWAMCNGWNQVTK